MIISQWICFDSKKRRKKQFLMIDWTGISENTLFFSSYWLSVSYHRWTWVIHLDGQINYCRDGARKQGKYPASCRLDQHLSFLSHERSLIFMGGSLLLEMTRSSETDSWLIYLSCRQGGVWYTDLCKKSKGVSYVSEWTYCWEWFQRDSALPGFTLSV